MLKAGYYHMAVGAGLGLIAGAVLQLTAAPAPGGGAPAAAVYSAPGLNLPERGAGSDPSAALGSQAAAPGSPVGARPDQGAGAGQTEGGGAGPNQGTAAAEVLLYVEPGEDAAQVVEQLVRAGLVRSAPSFTERLVALHYDGRIQPGAYDFRRDIAEGELADRLVHGP